MGLPRVFLITPFSHTSAGNEDPATYARVQQAVEEGARLANVTLVHPKEIQEAGNVLDQILTRLDDADAVLAILTGYNPNILFEIGYAARRAPILIGPDAEQLPFDLRIYRVVRYANAAEIAALPKRIAAAIGETLATAADRMEPPIREYIAALDRRVRTSPFFLPQALQGGFGGDLATHFVPIRLHDRTVTAGPDAAADIEVSNLFREDPNNSEPKNLVVLGTAGAGKSTLLRYLALHAWDAPQRVGLDREHLPMIVTARAVAESTGLDITARLRAALEQDRSLLLTSDPPAGFVQAWARRTRRPWLFLIDAADEVPVDLRGPLGTWLEEFSTWCRAEGHRLVLTGRPEMPSLLPAASTRVLHMRALDEDLQEQLARSLLGDRADGFVQALHGSRLRSRLRSPLWFVLAAARFAETGRLPEKRVALVESLIADALDRTRDARRWASVDQEVAVTARTILERVALESNPYASVAAFLEQELHRPAVVAQGLAPDVLRDLAYATGLLLNIGRTWTFTSMQVLEHLAACAALKKFGATEERQHLVESWWHGEHREIVVAMLGLIDDEQEVSRLLRRVVPISKWRPLLRQDPPAPLSHLRFVADCVLDGVTVDPKMLERIRGDVALRVRNSGERVIAGEILALLGDNSELDLCLRDLAVSLEDRAYAAAALSLMGAYDPLERVAGDGTLSLEQRFVALQAVPPRRRLVTAQRILKGADVPDDVASMAAVIVVRSGEPDAVRTLLRQGTIGEKTLDVIAAAAADAGNPDLLFEASNDDAVPAAVRSALLERLPVITMLLLKAMTRNSALEQQVRIAARWLLGEMGDKPDLAPLFAEKGLSPGVQYGAALVAVSRDPGALLDLVGRNDVDLRVQRFTVWITLKAENWDAIEAVIAREDLPSNVRLMALETLLGENRARGFLVIGHLPASSAIATVARALVADDIRQLTEIARDKNTSSDTRVKALHLLAAAGQTEVLYEIVRGPGDTGGVAMMVAKEAGMWSLFEALARDGSLSEQTRMVALLLLEEGGRVAELQRLAAAEELPSSMRSVANAGAQKAGDTAEGAAS